MWYYFSWDSLFSYRHVSFSLLSLKRYSISCPQESLCYSIHKEISMRLGVLFSGGKDSALALYEAMKTDEVICLISIISENRFSYMFHTPTIEMTELQARCMELPLIQHPSKGEKEKELKDLKHALQEAMDVHEVEGIVTGAIESVYQAVRIHTLCHALDIWCFNPLWLKDQKTLLYELVDTGFEIIISGVFAYPLSEEWLGRAIDKHTIEELVQLQEKYAISPSGEGGEIETLVLDAPYFKKKIEIMDSVTEFDKNTGFLSVTKAHLVDK
jgi:ABC transporter with metal-binding/Fe-S-binding domain ATP-binding protein